MALVEYKSKPIMAYRWFKDSVNEDVNLLEKPNKIGDMEFIGSIGEEGSLFFMYVCDGDWIVKYDNETITACSDKYFHQLYNVIEEPILPCYNN